MYDLSIVVPIKDTPVHLLDRCLESIKSNVCFGISTQIFVIDDFSSNSYYDDYCKLIKTKFKDVNIKRNSFWKGIGGARNEGVKASNSQYVLFVDSDDIIRKNATEKLMRHVSNSRVVFSNHITYDPHMCTSLLSNKSIWIGILEKYDSGFDCPFLHTNFICVPSIIPVRAFNEVGGYPELVHSGEHVALWGKLYFNLAMEFFHIDEVLYEYYPRSDGNSCSDPLRHREGKRDQFMNIAQLSGITADDYVWVANGLGGLPGLYAPCVQGVLHIPSWAVYDTLNKTWHFKRLVRDT